MLIKSFLNTVFDAGTKGAEMDSVTDDMDAANMPTRLQRSELTVLFQNVLDEKQRDLLRHCGPLQGAPCDQGKGHRAEQSRQG